MTGSCRIPRSSRSHNFFATSAWHPVCPTGYARGTEPEVVFMISRKPRKLLQEKIIS
jgi:hypothetical protein